MITISSINELQPQVSERRPGSWGAAFLAGLPHLIMGLLIGVGKLGGFDLFQVSETGNLIIGVSLAALVIGILIFAWRHGWPLWSASWYFYGTFVSFGVISLAIENANLDDAWRYTNALYLIWILFCIIGYFVILLKSKIYGLLSVACLFPMLSISMFEFIPNPIEGWFAMAVGLFSGLAAGMIVRARNFRPALVLVLGVNLTVGLAWAFISEYKMLDLPPGIPAHIPQFTNFLGFLAFYSIFGLGVVTIPFILRGLWNISRRKLVS